MPPNSYYRITIGHGSKLEENVIKVRAHGVVVPPVLSRRASKEARETGCSIVNPGGSGPRVRPGFEYPENVMFSELSELRSD